MSLKIEMLRCFAAVAECGNLADAAARLGRSPSALSMTLKQLEDRLGGRLFETGQKAHLSALGAFVLDHARREVEHFDRTVRLIESFASAEQGFVRVAAVPSVAAQILPGVVKRYTARRPGVHLEIWDTDSAGVIRALETEKVDIGIATAGNAGTWLKREQIMSDTFGIVCRADHPLAAKKGPLPWSVLKKWSFIVSGLTKTINNPTFRRIADASTLRVHNTTSILALVRADVGVTVLPRLVTQSDPDLVCLPVEDADAMRSIELLRREQSGLSPAAVQFAEELRAATAG